MARTSSDKRVQKGSVLSEGAVTARTAVQTTTKRTASAQSDNPEDNPKESTKEAAAPRRPGRPSGSARGPEQRDRLLDAALTLFARQGIVDTTLGEISREAGFTPAMVHYYFKTRDQLLDVLIDERFLPLRTALGGAFLKNRDDPVAAISQLARRLVDVAVEHPWFPSLWVREVISEGGLLRQRMFERFGNGHQRATLACLVRWQKEGRLNPGLEPSLVFVTLLGLTILPLATSKLWRNDPVRRNLGADDIARHAVALLVHGVGPQRGN